VPHATGTQMSRRYVAPLLGWLAVAVVVTVVEGVPTRLPGLALGSAVLLHAVRVVALFAIGLVIGTVLARASSGRLPSEVSTTGLVYSAEETGETLAALAELQAQVARQDALLDEIAARLDRLGRRI
jgi:hypothetical protein